VAIAYGIRLALPDGTLVDINQVTQSATAVAGGLPGTATTVRTVDISGVTVTKPSRAPDVICAGSCRGSASLLDALNSLDPAHLFVTLPSPDQPFGVEQDGVSPKGSPGGYLATVQASVAQQGGDEKFNGMTGFSGTEKSFLPALRVILYDPGDATLSREILDFAGVEVDAALGVDVVGTDSTTIVPTVDSTQSMIQAGLTGAFNNATGTTPGSSGTSGQQRPVVYHSGLLGVLERTLDGLRWLVRSPWAGAQMAAFLVLLGLPVMALRRRWAGRLTTNREG
jgi:hypothetical protein